MEEADFSNKSKQEVINIIYCTAAAFQWIVGSGDHNSQDDARTVTGNMGNTGRRYDTGIKNLKAERRQGVHHDTHDFHT